MPNPDRRACGASLFAFQPSICSSYSHSGARSCHQRATDPAAKTGPLAVGPLSAFGPSKADISASGTNCRQIGRTSARLPSLKFYISRSSLRGNGTGTNVTDTWIHLNSHTPRYTSERRVANVCSSHKPASFCPLQSDGTGFSYRG